MNLDYAVERLYETDWLPTVGEELETLSDGRRYPSVAAVRRAFAKFGLQLQIKHNTLFNCHRATWSPAAETPDVDHTGDESHGTVVGTCEHEAAVYALAQLRNARAERGALAQV